VRGEEGLTPWVGTFQGGWKDEGGPKLLCLYGCRVREKAKLPLLSNVTSFLLYSAVGKAKHARTNSHNLFYLAPVAKRVHALISR